MIRVLHVCAGLETGGGELFLERLVQSLNGGAFEQHVVLMLGIGPIGTRLRSFGVEVYALDCRGKPGAARALYRLRSRLGRIRPDIVQGWMYHGNLAAWAATRLARSRCPLLWNIRHSLDQWPDESLFWRSEIRLGGWLSGAPQRIVFNSAHSARQHERIGYPRAKASVIPNGFDLARFAPNAANGWAVRAELGIGTDDVVFGTLGRFHSLKDHANLLRAARIVADATSRAKFLLAGRQVTAENRVLMNLVRELQLEDRVRLLGERDDVADLLNACDIYVSSSSSEAFPNAVGEAMSCEIPCVVTNVGDSAELVGDTGIVVAPKSSEELARSMLELIRAGADRRRVLGLAARERIRENYSMARVARQYAELYRSVCVKER